MKFYGTPNMGVYERRTRKDIAKNKRPKLIFRFDANGEYVTEDAQLIEKLKRKFRFEETEAAPATNSEITEDTKQRHCKKCDFTCETQGELLKHYREQHPKGGD